MSNLTLTGAGPESGATFSVATMTGIQGWWDFSATGVADGVAIASVTDGSGNARTLSQATGSLQPLSKTGANGINSLAVALFDGVDDALITASFALAQPFTIYVVMTGGGAGGANRVFGTGGAAIRVGYDTTPGSGAGDNFAGSSLIGTASTAFGTPKVMTSVFNGGSSLIRVDGAQTASGAIGAGTIATGVSVGNASTTANAQPWNGKVGEVFFTNVSTVDTAAEAYLKAKWGTA